MGVMEWELEVHKTENEAEKRIDYQSEIMVDKTGNYVIGIVILVSL